jgi:hypothetical protein
MSSRTMDGREHDLNLLAAYVEDRLDAAERERVAAHVSGCDECRAVLAELGRGLAASRRGSGRLARLPRSTALPIAAVLVLSAATSLILLRQSAQAPTRSEGERSPAPDTASATPSATSATPPPSAAPSPGGREPTVRGNSTDREDLLVKRGGGAHSVAGKSFRLVAGEWVDTAYDPLASLPVVQATGPAERAALLQRVPGLAAYAALGERLLVVHEGIVYRLRPAAAR